MVYANPFICIFEGKPASLYDRNNPDWVPNLSLGYTYPHLLQLRQHSDIIDFTLDLKGVNLQKVK